MRVAVLLRNLDRSHAAATMVIIEVVSRLEAGCPTYGIFPADNVLKPSGAVWSRVLLAETGGWVALRWFAPLPAASNQGARHPSQRSRECDLPPPEFALPPTFYPRCRPSGERLAYVSNGPGKALRHRSWQTNRKTSPMAARPSGLPR
jgi:hypothetical protein